MVTNKQTLLGFALLAMLVVPVMVSAQTTVSTGTATEVSSQNENLLNQDCALIESEDNASTLNLDTKHNGSTLVKLVQSIGTSASSSIKYFACPAEAIAKIQTSAGVSIITGVSKTLVIFFSGLVALLNGFLSWILEIAGYLLIAMIGQGKFITSDIVTQAWPFVQGLANLGFIFALLYIALATTLRLESVSSSIQRLLPKLLIAALLVNFSLVIGGLIIDASRLLMAAEISIMGGGSLDYENFTANLIESSKHDATSLSNIEIIDSSNASAAVLKMIQSTIFLGLLTAAIFIIAVNLFIRYVALLILLILSPMAYLALALPNTSQYAKQWWGMFIKWVLYGPIVLFFLIIITRIQNVNITLSETSDSNPLFTVFFNQFIHFAIIIALFFVANSVGKKVAGAGSDAVMGFAKKNPRAAFIAGSSLLTGGLSGAALGAAGVWAGGMARNSGRDFSSKISSDFATRARSGQNYLGVAGTGAVAKFFAGPERDDKGKLKKGQKSAGSIAGGFISNKAGLGDPNKKIIANNIKAALAGAPLTAPGGVLSVPTALVEHINGAGLSQGHITKAIGATNLKMVVEHTANKSDLSGLAQNEDHLRELGSTGRSELIQSVNRNTNISANDKADIVNRIVKTVKDKDL